MRLVRYERDGRVWPGCVELRSGADVVRTVDGEQRPGTVVAGLDELTLVAPCDPRTIVCVGSNYLCQIQEKGRDRPDRPALFLKAPNAVVGPGRPILHPPDLDRLEYEGELAVVIGTTARDVREDDAMRHVLGLTCANDVTADDWRADGQWARAKSADTFCPIGPWIETEPGPGPWTLTTRVGERVAQRGDTSRMIFSVPRILAYVSRYFTLQPGDVVLTGSPAGVGPMAPGDRVTVEIDGVGSLTNPVVRRTPGPGFTGPGPAAPSSRPR